MLLPRCSIWCIFFLCLAACDLEISQLVSDELTCSEGLSDCSLSDGFALGPLRLTDEDTAHVQNLTAYFKLCCEDRVLCALCVGIDIEVIIHLEKDSQDEDHSGQPQEDDVEGASSRKVEVVVTCYHAVNSMPVCKRVEFAASHMTDTQQQRAKISLTITRPMAVSFGTRVTVYPCKAKHLRQVITAPSLDEVCSQNLQEYVQECRVPRLGIVINSEMNRVELLPEGSHDNRWSMCVQYERNGRCQEWKEMSIPLYSVTPCTCFQFWKENYQRSVRSWMCPFKSTDIQIQRNVWQNISVSLARGQINNFGSVLWWNLSAPCRLTGEVWLCHQQESCSTDGQAVRQQLSNGTWRQNNKGLWERAGVFEDIHTQFPPCVMVKVEGMPDDLGPYCFNSTSRQRWSLLLVGFTLLVCLTVLIFCLLHGSVKKWARGCRYCGFVKIGGKGHVVLLNPPGVDEGVWKSASQLGSLLGSHGFSVSVDCWSREQQCSMGPVPWLHSQLLELRRQGGRVVLVLTRKALETAEEWTRREATRSKAEDGSASPRWSPHSDAFVACLRLIHSAKQTGKARELFVLVRFDCKPPKDNTLPELLQELPLFHLPSQTQALLTELTVGRSRGGLRTPQGRCCPDSFTARNAEEEKLQSELLHQRKATPDILI